MSLRSTHFGLRDDTPTGNAKLVFLSPFSSMVRNFLSCDWGTSHLRLRLVETATLRVLAEIKTGDGAAMINQAGLETERGARFSQALLACARCVVRYIGVAGIDRLLDGGPALVFPRPTSLPSVQFAGGGFPRGTLRLFANAPRVWPGPGRRAFRALRW